MTRATLPERYGDAQQATAAIDKILAGYKAHSRSDEEGYWWARDAQGEEFRFVISGG